MKMNLIPITIVLLFLCSLNSFNAGSDNPTHFTGDVSINCGSSGTSVARNDREWLGDERPKLPSFLQIKGSSTTSTIIHKSIDADPIPHKTARTSQSQFSYSFQVNPGQKILRLHFNPATYWGFNSFGDLFTVEAGPFTLLGNFSASLTADALGVHSFAKEFCLNIEENQQLTITFSPESSNTYAFINGIEIISVPSTLYYFHDSDTDYSSALEIIHRQNFKQSSVLPSGDFDDLFPTWAMRKGQKINNTWKISVNVGFRYLIRLHFSELGLKLAESGDLILKVLINEMNAHTNVVKESDDSGILWYRDYVVMIRGHKKEGKRDVLISLQSYDESVDGHGLLAGFEILKLSNPDNSLASPNPSPPKQDSSSHTLQNGIHHPTLSKTGFTIPHSPKWDSPSHTLQTLLSLLGHRSSIATVVITIFALVNIIVHKLREVWEASITEEENKPSARAKRFCRRFSLAEILLATKNFNGALLIGKGGFGNVYKGLIDNEQKTVAIKRLKSTSNQGAHEFLMEIETLSELRHVNLVSLIGYCNENGEMILVYEYVASGTLVDHFYKLARDSNNCSNITWKQCLNICIGAGRGLDYLHTGHRLIHRDVKASNILLDENFEAKVSDFGLAKPEDRSKLESHVSTNVKGTVGYLDPNYQYTSKLTRKSDTYAFGVVLMVVLCGRPAADRRLGVAEDERILSKWARDKICKGEVDQIVASSLKEEISPDSLKTFVGIAERCLCDEPKKRPTMSQVVLKLEIALEQQEIKRVLVPNEIASVSDYIHPCNDETNLSAYTGQLTMVSTDVQSLTPLLKGQTNNTEPPSARKDGLKSITYKPSRLWPWETFWSRVKPLKKNELLLSELFEVNVKLRHFDWATIAAATNQFSSSNKVGEGGFGPVYKAMLPTGEAIAVKRLHKSSGQGVEEFKNEILLLPNLQHRNIINLLGYCIHGEEKLIVYEFMKNRSLDTFLVVEEARRQQLQWRMRFKIIMGIARGVVYLHEDSGMGVIYRDLKCGNILLDIEMNPKISDFAFARTLVAHQAELETIRAVGTCGYMAPEYCMEGKYSVKSDVHSFGIIVLQIVSGRSMYRPYPERMFLLDYVWKLWSVGKALDLVDDSLGGAFPVEEALRCIQVGLLCTQELPHRRPTMSCVLKMLEGKELLVEPQKPWDQGVDSVATFEYDDTLPR